MAYVLAVDMAGVPSRWLVLEGAITYYAKKMVAWSTGDIIATFKGGISKVTGERSEISTRSIIAVKGAIDYFSNNQIEPPLSNRELFSRDRSVCAYCGHKFFLKDLSCDHVVPVNQGGKSNWTNAVTSCRSCNIKKGGKTPEQAKMPLLYLPYVPNRYEHLILQNKRILDDQMEFLISKVPKHSRLRAR